MYYLKLFQNHSEYETFVSGDTMVRPNVSHCIQENDVHYNKYIEPLIAKYYVDEKGIEESEPYNLSLYYYKRSGGTSR